MSDSRLTTRLWAPWRMTYIERAAGAKPAVGTRRGAARSRTRKAEAGCLFCRVERTRSDRRDLVVARRPHAFLMLNLFPYNPAHLMVAVARHTARLGGMTAAERLDLLDLTALAERALALEYRPHGVNYGANVGRVAGAGFPGHFHLHLVPRWNGDTNFMPTVAETKVLPESLDRTWSRLRRAVHALEAPRGRRPGREAQPRPRSRRSARRRI